MRSPENQNSDELSAEAFCAVARLLRYSRSLCEVFKGSIGFESVQQNLMRIKADVWREGMLKILKSFCFHEDIFNEYEISIVFDFLEEILKGNNLRFCIKTFKIISKMIENDVYVLDTSWITKFWLK